MPVGPLSVLLYSSVEATAENADELADANVYLPFKALDVTVTKRIVEELDNLPDLDEERKYIVSLHSLYPFI